MSLPVGVTTHPVEVFDANYWGYHTVVCHACLWVECHKDYGLAVVAGRQHQSLFDTKEDTMTHTTPDAIDFTKRRWSNLIRDAEEQCGDLPPEACESRRSDSKKPRPPSPAGRRTATA